MQIAGGPFAFKNKIRPTAVKLLWEKLSFWIVEVLKSQKVSRRKCKSQRLAGGRLMGQYFHAGGPSTQPRQL